MNSCAVPFIEHRSNEQLNSTDKQMNSTGEQMNSTAQMNSTDGTDEQLCSVVHRAHSYGTTVLVSPLSLYNNKCDLHDTYLRLIIFCFSFLKHQYAQSFTENKVNICYVNSIILY